MKSVSAFAFATCQAAFTLATMAAVLPPLSPATALYDSDVKGFISDGANGPGAAGHLSGVPALNATEHLAGFTFNAEFTPAEDDLSGTVILIALGGTSNGAGLYLMDGIPTLVCKQDSFDWAVPASRNDTSLKEIAVQSTLGLLAAGTRYSFSATWNQQGTLELVAQPEGGEVVRNTFTIIGTPGNWSGADTLSVGAIGSKGYVGGLGGNANVVTAAFDVDFTKNFTGTFHRALLWNAAALSVGTPAVRILSSEISAGNLVLHFSGDPSRTYKVRGSDDLLSFPIDHGTVSTDALGQGQAVVPMSGRRGFVRIEE